MDINSENGQDGRPGSDGNSDSAEQSQEEAEPSDGGTGTASDSGQGGEVATEETHDFNDLDTSAIAERIDIADDDWTEGDEKTPTYKRTITIDGKHKVIQVDEPDSNGFYTGSRFEYQGEQFGSLTEVIDIIDGNTVCPVCGKRHIPNYKAQDVVCPQCGTDLSVFRQIDQLTDEEAEQVADNLGLFNEDGTTKSLQELVAAAEAEVNTEPTEAQKEAGNYKKGHVQVAGFDITIEQPKGSVRRGTSKDKDGNETPWETTMQNDYGYIRGTEGVDGDHIDVFLSDTPEEGDVFVVDQVNEDGSFDEHKVMYGFPTEQAARDAYLSNYEPGWTGLGAITHVSKDEFKKWIGSSRRKTKPFAEYKSVKIYKEQNPNLAIEPDGFGDFGPVFTQFKGDAQGAIKVLSELQDGEAIGALHHKDIGDIDLVWGNAGTGNSDGFGLAKLVKFHPEVVEHLQEILDDMHIVKRSENRINLESDTHKAAVRLTWNKEKKKWLLTAFEKRETSESIGKTTDTDDNPSDLRGDTALSQNSDVSDGKVNTLSADKQADGAESSKPYTITPTTYTNKRNKTSNVFLVKFNRELTDEERAALNTFINEPLTEGKKTSRGWYGREQGGYMMRSEEAARQLAEMIGNEEAVADAQPLSLEDMRPTTGMAQVDVEGLMTQLSETGEDNLADFSTPIKTDEAKPETDKPVNPSGNKLVTDERYAELRVS